jgi:hypothetical protein
VTCCTPKGAASGKPEFTVAGVPSAIASGAIVVACTDLADPFWRGQEATPPAKGELTTGERVVAKWSLLEPPNAGKPYTADVSWTYQRFTTGASYSHSVTETQTNVHVAGDVEIDTATTARGLRSCKLGRTSRRRFGAHLFLKYQGRRQPARRHRASSGPFVPQLARCPRAVAGPNQGGSFSSLMVERQGCRFRRMRNVHLGHLPIHPLHHPPDGLQWYASIGIGHRNLRRHVEP